MNIVERSLEFAKNILILIYHLHILEKLILLKLHFF